jgi:hypothetical protein
MRVRRWISLQANAAGWVSSCGCKASASPHQRDARAPETVEWREDVVNVDEEDGNSTQQH